jgi:hypothetical protein
MIHRTMLSQSTVIEVKIITAGVGKARGGIKPIANNLLHTASIT